MATDVARVSILIGDKAQSQFDATEVQDFLDIAGNIYGAAALACEAWAGALAREETSESIGATYSYKKNSARNLMNLAERFRGLEREKPSFDYAEQNVSVFSGEEIAQNDATRTG